MPNNLTYVSLEVFSQVTSLNSGIVSSQTLDLANKSLSKILKNLSYKYLERLDSEKSLISVFHSFLLI